MIRNKTICRLGISWLALLAIIGLPTLSVAEATKVKIVLVGDSTVTDDAGRPLDDLQQLRIQRTANRSMRTAKRR